MTGTPISLRRWSNCNLHFYGPRPRPRPGPRPRNLKTLLSDPPPRYNRMKIYIPPRSPASPPSRLYGEDKRGTYTWMRTDCGWQWLANLPFIRETPLNPLLERVCDHVHKPHSTTRYNLALAFQRLIVRSLRSPTLDTKLETRVYPDSHLYTIRVRMSNLSSEDRLFLTRALAAQDIEFLPSRPPVATWLEKASNPSHALERARARLTGTGLPLAGTGWETPVLYARVDTP